MRVPIVAGPASLATIVMLIAAAAACKVSSRTPDAPGTTGDFITYEFNGSAYSGSSLASATLMANTSGGSVLGVEANDPDGHMLAIAVEPATPSAMIAVGSYATGSAPPLSTFEFTNGSNGTWAAAGQVGGSGSLTVTLLTATVIEGTFEATMVGSAGSQGTGTLASGMFELSLQ